MSSKESLPYPPPPTEEHDDTVEAHYACLERPHACMGGWVFVGYIDEYGEEREVSYACRRCADNALSRPDKPCSYRQRLRSCLPRGA